MFDFAVYVEKAFLHKKDKNFYKFLVSDGILISNTMAGT
jgi:hypothetical protein